MRTTLSIDDDVLLALKERAARERRTVGAVLSDLARQALVARSEDESGSADSYYGFDPLPNRGVAVSNSLIDRLRDDEGV